MTKLEDNECPECGNEFDKYGICSFCGYVSRNQKYCRSNIIYSEER